MLTMFDKKLSQVKSLTLGIEVNFLPSNFRKVSFLKLILVSSTFSLLFLHCSLFFPLTSNQAGGNLKFNLIVTNLYSVVQKVIFVPGFWSTDGKIQIIPLGWTFLLDLCSLIKIPLLRTGGTGILITFRWKPGCIFLNYPLSKHSQHSSHYTSIQGGTID